MEIFLAVFSAILLADLFGRVLNYFETKRSEALFQQKIEQMKEMHDELTNGADKETQRILEALIKGEPIDTDENGEWKYYDR